MVGKLPKIMEDMARYFYQNYKFKIPKKCEILAKIKQIIPDISHIDDIKLILFTKGCYVCDNPHSPVSSKEKWRFFINISKNRSDGGIFELTKRGSRICDSKVNPEFSNIIIINTTDPLNTYKISEVTDDESPYVCITGSLS